MVLAEPPTAAGNMARHTGFNRGLSHMRRFFYGARIAEWLGFRLGSHWVAFGLTVLTETGASSEVDLLLLRGMGRNLASTSASADFITSPYEIFPCP